MPIIETEQETINTVIGNSEYLDEEGTQTLIAMLKDYADQELTTPLP